jgi:putative ABC transport system substrate-binding protein
VRRREFITFVGCAAAAWPLAARAQQPTATTHRLGLLFATSERGAKARGLLEAVTQGLKEYGWVEGQNITIEYRFAPMARRMHCQSSPRRWFNCGWTPS